jgi:hypothetical protein
MKWWMKSKAILGAIGYGAVKVLVATGHVAPELGMVLEGLAGTLFGIGVRDKQQKTADAIKPATSGGGTGGTP